MIQTMDVSITTVYFFIVLPIFAVFYVVYILVKKRKDSAVLKEWLSKHPDAAKVFYNTNMVGLGQISIESVDGDAPLFFTEGFKGGFYVAPGDHIIESSYTFSRPGIFYRRVSTTYGPSKQEVTVDSSKRYLYSFDRKTKSYSFTEIAG